MGEIEDLRTELEMLELQLEEERELREDELLSMPIHSPRHRAYKTFSFVAAGYLALSALSIRVTGPGHWLGLAQHVHLIAHIEQLL